MEFILVTPRVFITLSLTIDIKSKKICTLYGYIISIIRIHETDDWKHSHFLILAAVSARIHSVEESRCHRCLHMFSKEILTLNLDPISMIYPEVLFLLVL